MTRELSDKWWLCPVSRRTLFVFSEALICLSYTAFENGPSGRICTCDLRLIGPLLCWLSYERWWRCHEVG